MNTLTVLRQPKYRAFHSVRYALCEFNKLDPVDKSWEMKFLLLLVVGAGLVGIIARFWG